MSMFNGFVIADFDSFKKHQESKSASPIKQLRHQSLFQVFCTFVVQKHFNPSTLLYRSQASLAFLTIFILALIITLQNENKSLSANARLHIL